MPQTPMTVRAFKPEIDGTPWLVVKLTHTLGDQGLTTRLELETRGLQAERV
ncbi:phage late control protein GPD [compost metagenome]